MSSYYIGVDGGASKTASLVIDESGKHHGEGIAGGSNHLRIGLEAAARNVEHSVSIALREAGIAMRDVAWAYCGIAGADHPAHRAKVVESLKMFFPGGNFTVDSDARVALTGAIGFGKGVVIISGTGSVAYGRSESGEEERAGGWGPTLGDEGSGYAIAREGLAAIVRSFDGRGQTTEMTDLLCREYDMCNPADLPKFVYAQTTHADDIARYTRMVIEAANDGDEVARQILAHAGEELAACVLAVARRLDLCDSEFPVAHVGGAFHAGELLLEPMRKLLHAEAPYAKLIPPLHSPVEGAALMAVNASTHPRPTRARA